MNYFIAVFVYIVFWVGLAMLGIWFYRQFQTKKDSGLLAGGLILLYLVGALWCASIWFSFSNQMFGGWGMGMTNMKNWGSANQETIDLHNQMHELMVNEIETNGQ